jgi:hypothetical protein
MKKTKLTQAVVGAAAVVALTATVGKIIPMNLHANNAGFSVTTAAIDDCCGPYSQPGCTYTGQPQ